MSNTIEARFYNARQATQLQRRPSELIDAAESFHPELQMQFYGGGERRYILRINQSGAMQPVLNVNTPFFFLLATSSIPTVSSEDDNADSWSDWSKVSVQAFEKSTVVAKPSANISGSLRVNRLSTLQAILGLSTTDLAQVLKLSRPGLYKWLDAASDVKLQEANSQRLAAIERIAHRWQERSMATLSSVANAPLADGRNILAMMMADEVDEAAVVGAFDELEALLNSRPKSPSQKLVEAGFKRRLSAKSLPSDE